MESSWYPCPNACPSTEFTTISVWVNILAYNLKGSCLMRLDMNYTILVMPMCAEQINHLHRQGGFPIK